MSVKPTIAISAYLNSSWVALNWAADTVSVSQGKKDNKPTTRLASVGRLTFTLNNADDIYTPGHSSALAGWKTGVKIKLVITYDGDDYPSIWHIDTKNGIKIEAKQYSSQKAKIICYDWLDYAMKQPVDNPTIVTDVTADSVATTLLGNMPIEPINTTFDTGTETFSTALDTVTDRTKVYSELAKLALSEWGHIYIRPDTTDGETLHFENFTHRSGLDEETIFDTDKVYDGDNTYMDANITNGDNRINSVRAYSYPRKKDAAAVILFTLSEPLMIASGQTITLRGTYANPDGGNVADGFDMVTPVATTDYLMNTQSDGGGDNKTADLTVVHSYGADGFAHELTNGVEQNCWITKFNCRGKGIYLYNPLTYVAENDTSIDETGTIQQTIYQRYQKTMDLGTMIANTIVEFEKDSDTRINSITFCANTSDRTMKEFLELGIGDMIRLKSTKGGIDAFHYIVGVRYTILPGRVIMVKWIVKQILTLALGLSLLACCFSQVGTADMIDYGVIPQITNLDEITVSAWVYIDHYATLESGTSMAIISNFSDYSGYILTISSDSPGLVQFYQKSEDFPGAWTADDDQVALKTWTHILVTKDTTNPTDDPHIYIDGVDQTITEKHTPIGATKDETGNHLMVGNFKTATRDYDYPFYGSIQGIRIYDVILDQAAATALHGAGRTDTDTELDNLVWQGGCFKSSDVSEYDGTQILDDDHRPVDNIYNVVGTGNGLPLPFVTTPPTLGDVKSLLHFNGADESTTFTDETGRIWTATGNAQIDTAVKKFGTGGGLFDGAANSWITTPDHPSFILADNDWTFDFWIRFSDVANPSHPTIFTQRVDATTYFAIIRETATNTLQCLQYEGSSWIWQLTAPFDPSVDTWYHVAVVRNGNTPLMFIDGVSQTVTETVTISGKTAGDIAAPVYIGALRTDNMIEASIDEFRFTNGTAQWTSNFTPPTEEYTY